MSIYSSSMSSASSSSCIILIFFTTCAAQNCLSLRQETLCVYLFFFHVISIIVILHNPHLLHHLCCPAVHSSSRNLDYPLLNPSPDRPGTIDLLNHKGHDTRVRNSEYRACEPRRQAPCSAGWSWRLELEWCERKILLPGWWLEAGG